MASFNDLQARPAGGYAAEAEALELRREATEARRRRSPRPRRRSPPRRRPTDAKLAEAEKLLDKLKAEEREALLSRGGSQRVPSNVPASGRAGAAISYAMAQVGDAYVYGAAGLNAFDCSGLTMMAWAQAGVAPAALLQRPVPPARASPRATCSRATWSSTTARSATSACTSATA